MGEAEGRSVGKAQSMPIEPEVGCAVLREMVSELERSGLKYWLGRGVFRHWRRHREFGGKQDDVDFHVLRQEEAQLRSVVHDLCRMGYEKVLWDDKGHKIPLKKATVPIELIFLERKGRNLSFRAEGTGNKLYTCPAWVFGNRTLKICGVKVRVPGDQYLPVVYGPNWKAEEEDNGGVTIC